MKSAVIVAYKRSPFTPANKGALARLRADDMAAQTIAGLLQSVKFPAHDIEDLLLGCAFPEGEQGLNIARLVAFIAQLPTTVAGATVNRFCGSSMQSIHMAAGNIAAGAGEVFIAAGVESMTRVPMGGYNPLPNPALYAAYPQAYIAMGLTAENLAKQYAISRQAQEAFALASHQKAAKANFADEIIPMQIKDKQVSVDGCIRADSSLEALATLAPAFDAQGTVTAGTSSPLTDGAAVVLVTSEEYAKKNNLPMLARIKSFAVSGCAPEIMGIGPVGATQKALARAGLNISDMDVIELNEAFSAQSLAVIQDLKIDQSKLNLDGGAIALGHPLGASGARITGKAAQLLKKTGGKYALATQCIGGGQGIATVLEAL